MIVRILTILIFLGINAFALNIPAKPDERVIDQTHTLSNEQKEILTNMLNNIYDTESHTEIQVLMIQSLNNEPIENVSLDIARKWKIGQKDTNNGVLILIAVDDHKYRIEVGYGLEGVLPDGYIGNLERNIINPYFARNEFFTGLNLAITNLSREIVKDYNTNKLTNNQQISPENVIIYITLGIVVFVIIAALAAASGNMTKVNNILWFILKIMTIAALFRGGGSNNRNNNNDDIGGGGSFGGGGSSNKW